MSIFSFAFEDITYVACHRVTFRVICLVFIICERSQAQDRADRKDNNDSLFQSFE